MKKLINRIKALFEPRLTAAQLHGSRIKIEDQVAEEFGTEVMSAVRYLFWAVSAVKTNQAKTTTIKFHVRADQNGQIIIKNDVSMGNLEQQGGKEEDGEIITTIG